MTESDDLYLLKECAGRIFGRKLARIALLILYFNENSQIYPFLSLNPGSEGYLTLKFVNTSFRRSVFVLHIEQLIVLFVESRYLRARQTLDYSTLTGSSVT